MCPNHVRYEQSVVCSVQSYTLRFRTIVHYYVECTHYRYDELLKCSMRMRASSLSAGHIIQIENTFDLERHVGAAVNRRDRAFSFTYLGQLNDFAVFDGGSQRILFILWNSGYSRI